MQPIPKDREIEMLVTQIRNKLHEADKYYVEHEMGIGRRYGENNLIEELFYDGRETLVIKFNHNEEGELNPLPETDPNYVMDDTARKFIETMIERKNKKANQS